jgi:hypothetical protein
MMAAAASRAQGIANCAQQDMQAARQLFEA